MASTLPNSSPASSHGEDESITGASPSAHSDDDTASATGGTGGTTAQHAGCTKHNCPSIYKLSRYASDMKWYFNKAVAVNEDLEAYSPPELAVGQDGQTEAECAHTRDIAAMNEAVRAFTARLSEAIADLDTQVSGLDVPGMRPRSPQGSV